MSAIGWFCLGWFIGPFLTLVGKTIWTILYNAYKASQEKVK